LSGPALLGGERPAQLQGGQALQRSGEGHGEAVRPEVTPGRPEGNPFDASDEDLDAESELVHVVGVDASLDDAGKMPERLGGATCDQFAGEPWPEASPLRDALMASRA